MPPPSRRRSRSLGSILDQTAPELADAVTDAASAPAASSGPGAGPSSARIVRIAPNPCNRRDVDARPDKIAELAKSLQEFGQVQASTVVHRLAFLAIFPELAETIGDVDYVQVTGARRRAAAVTLGWTELDISVKDHLAQSRARFVAATAVENIDREDYDPIEEAEQVQVVVDEAGSQAAAAEQLNRSGGWVSQRLNLRRLVDEVQAALRSGEVPVREVRGWHLHEPAEQLAALRRWRDQVARRERRDEQGEQPKPARPPRAVAAVRRLGDTPAKQVDTIAAGMSMEEARALLAEMQRRFGE